MSPISTSLSTSVSTLRSFSSSIRVRSSWRCISPLAARAYSTVLLSRYVSPTLSMMITWAQRPTSEAFRQRTIMDRGNEMAVGGVRGMKVRSSVKKLCDGCKVRLACQLWHSHVVSLSALLSFRLAPLFSRCYCASLHLLMVFTIYRVCAGKVTST